MKAIGRKPISKQRDRLKAASLNALPPGRHPDGAGLYLQVTAPARPGNPASMCWTLRYMIDGKPRTLGLGRYPDRSLADAREAARVARNMRADGIDPVTARQAEKAARRAVAEAARVAREAPLWTFRKVAEAYVKAVGRKWSPGHAADWSATLEQHAYDALGNLPVSAITKADVAGC